MNSKSNLMKALEPLRIEFGICSNFLLLKEIQVENSLVKDEFLEGQ